jgi:hypothetical protein
MIEKATVEGGFFLIDQLSKHMAILARSPKSNLAYRFLWRKLHIGTTAGAVSGVLSKVGSIWFQLGWEGMSWLVSAVDGVISISKTYTFVAVVHNGQTPTHMEPVFTHFIGTIDDPIKSARYAKTHIVSIELDVVAGQPVRIAAGVAQQARSWGPTIITTSLENNGRYTTVRSITISRVK